MRSDFRPRIHPLPWPEIPGCDFWLIRDDEFGFAASGGKLRKYASLLPYLVEQNIKTAYLIGGRNSNNLVGLSQALLEIGITPVPVVPEGHEGSVQGFNSLLLNLLVTPDTWRRIPKSEWELVETTVSGWVQADMTRGIRSICIPEGGFHPASLPGCMALAQDIENWQSQSGVECSHMVMEAGTGTSAIGLLLGGSGRKFPKVEILLLADSPDRFRQRLNQAGDWMGIKHHQLPAEGKHFDLHEPTSSKKFGKVNEKSVQTIVKWARRGILLDPVYSVRLFQEIPVMAHQGKISGNVLTVLSGGAHSLAGYAEKLFKIC